MDYIIEILNRPFFIIIGGITTIISIVSFVLIIYVFINGTIPILYKMAQNIYNKKIYIFADANAFSTLSNMVLDTNIFKKNNVEKLDSSEIKRACKDSLLLVHWKYGKNHINDILNHKSDKTFLIIYAPQKEGFIEQNTMDLINEQRNVIVVNMRGRLINDIFTSLITRYN